MITRASSGSRSCSSSVEPLISANRAVTVLRSPSSDASAWWALTVDRERSGTASRDAASTQNRAPHCLQNLASKGFSAPHFAQRAVSNWFPQPTQNLASSELSRLQVGQRIGLQHPLPRFYTDRAYCPTWA